MYICYNGKMMKKACLQPISQGFQFGYGVFETILVHKGLPCFFDMHYQRLVISCKKLSIQLRFDEETLNEQIISLAEVLNITEGRLKIICFRDIEGDSSLITLSPYQLEKVYIQKGIAIGISSIKRNPYSPLCYIKSLNYSENILAKEEAKSQGYDEALFLNVDNKLCEGAVSNIFWTKANVLYTPEISCGILEGITRRQVMNICSTLKLDIREGSYYLSELIQADEVFVTNSLMGIMPVCRVNNTIYNVSEYRITNTLYNEYKKLVEAAVRSNTKDPSNSSG